VYNIHISDIRTFRACRRKWNWSSPLKENLEPQVPYAPFFVGRAVHYCLEWYYGPAHRPVWDSLDQFLNNETKIAGDLWAAEQASWDESVELVQEMLMHYQLWVQVDPTGFRDETLEFMDLEVPFNVPMYHPETGKQDENIRLEGRFDGIVFHKPTGTYWIWECKTARSIGELAKSLENDEQAGAYIYAAQQLKNIPITGILYNILRKKAPTHPRILDSGYVSKAKGDFSPFSYIADIRRNHPDWDWDTIREYYGSVFSDMSIIENGFFARYPIKRTPKEITQLVANLYWTAQEMIDPDTKLYPSPTFIQCNFCMFRAPCLTMNRDGDYSALLRSEYQKRIKAESFREVDLS